jgi:hypothetical protein
MYGAIVIEQNNILKYEIYELERGFNEIRIAMKAITGYQYDNSKLIWTNIYGDPYSIMVTKTKKPKFAGEEADYCLHVWLFNESFSIGDKPFRAKYDDKLPSDVYKWLKDITENFHNGLFNCSGCKKKILISEISGQFYAGRYCKECWESKYKAIEAKENYN